jgi:hypothetical protein
VFITDLKLGEQVLRGRQGFPTDDAQISDLGQLMGRAGGHEQNLSK